MQSTNYSQEQLIEAVKNSTSIRGALKILGLKPSGGNYRTINDYIKSLNLDTSHHLGLKHNLGKKVGPTRPIEDYLSNKERISSSNLKKRLIKDGYFEHKCYSCLATHWKDDLIPIELHHINGNHLDNTLSNLAILCPNCHAQIHQSNKVVKPVKITEQKKCIDCNKNISSKAIRCKSCKAVLQQSKTTKRPPKDVLSEDLKSMSYVAIGRKYQVSDNAVRKWVKFYKM